MSYHKMHSRHSSFDSEGGFSSAKKNNIDNSKPILSNWKNIDDLVLVNLEYDLTPIDFVQVIITEMGMVPPTSVPVIIREQRRVDDALFENLQNSTSGG